MASARRDAAVLAKIASSAEFVGDLAEFSEAIVAVGRFALAANDN